ncbi:PD40 domain-containing protein [candidate division KSB1 bacterium]|nr:PD40 domain-containing protein [candidate division KSB1 bacterium]
MRRLIYIITLSALFGGLHTASFGQYYFGRNKIQYNNFKWYILKTEHFDIYYYPEMQELAEIGAAAAEETYRFLEDKFNHSVNRRIPLILYSNPSHFQQTNTIPYLLPAGVGGFFEFLKGRVVIPANGSIYDFKRVIRHELIHVFTHSKHYRILKDHKRTNFSDLPLWYVEGLAEYWSVGWDTDAELVIRDAVLNGYLFPLRDMYQIYGSYLMYKEGQAILKFIAEKYGEHKIIQLIENSWKEERFSNVLKLTIGLDYKEFDKEWLYYLKKEKFPLLQENDLPEMAAQKITEEGVNTKPAYYLKDGETPTVIFISNRMGYSNIYEKSLKDPIEDSKAKVLIEGERTSEFEAFNILKSKIYINSSGDKLTFVTRSGETDVIYTYDLKQNEIIDSYQFDDIVSYFSPCWSPDETKIVFTGIHFSGKSDLYIFDITNSKLDRLTNDFYDDRDPIWSKDSKYIYFSSDRTIFGDNGFYNLFCYNVDNGEINFITYGEQNDYSPAISKDGKYLAFSSDRDGAFNIWMLQLNKTEPLLVDNRATVDNYFSNDKNEIKKITHFTTAAYDPVWTDSNDIIFTAFENFSFQIKKIDNIIETYNKATVTTVDSLTESKTYWQVTKIDGNSTQSNVKYKPKFNLDIAQSQVTQDPIFGVSGGAQIAMTDMLGNYQYYFLIYNNAQTRTDFLKSFNIAISRSDLSRRTNFSYGAYHFAGRYFNWHDSFYYERLYGGFGAISYPISVFERIEGSINIRHSDKDWYVADHSRKAMLFSNFLSYVKDNSLWGPTGPVDGERINFTLGNTIDVQHSNVNFYTIIADYRKYFRLSQRVAHAVRLMTRYNHGKEALRFYMGGSWDLRGYPRWQIWGKKLFLISNELRYPFIDRFAINFPIGGMAFSSIRGATFIDLGNGWDEQLDDVLGSFGFGIRFRLGGVLVLRYDFGKRFAFKDANDLFNPDKFSRQKGVFQQFFFGWDF